MLHSTYSIALHSLCIALGSTSLNRGLSNPLFASKRYGPSQASSSAIGETGANGSLSISNMSTLVSSTSNLSLGTMAGVSLSDLNSSTAGTAQQPPPLPQAPPPPPLPNRPYQQIRASPLVSDSTPQSASTTSVGGASRTSPPGSGGSGMAAMSSASLVRGTAPPGGPKNTKV